MTTLSGMNEFIRPRSYGSGGVVVETSAEKLVFLRKVYGLFTASLVAALGGALVALYAGTGLSRVSVGMDGGREVVIPPIIAAFLNHPIIGMLMFFGAFMGASAVRQKPGLNVVALFGAAFFSGLFVAPMIWFATLMASEGRTLSASPVRDAFLLAVTGFGGLTTYALVSKKDFSALGGFLTMGLFVLIGASLLSMFVGGEAFSLAIASVGVLLFGGFILYDTSRLLRDPTNRDPVGAALNLYLNFLNLFVFLLRILSSSSRRNS